MGRPAMADCRPAMAWETISAGDSSLRLRIDAAGFDARHLNGFAYQAAEAVGLFVDDGDEFLLERRLR